MSAESKNKINNHKRWILYNLNKIKEGCETKNERIFLDDEFLEIYSHLIRIINNHENKKLALSLKRELQKIKKCCDIKCPCSYRCDKFLSIFDDLISIFDKYRNTPYNKTINKEFVESKETVELQETSEIEDLENEEEIELTEAPKDNEIMELKEEEESINLDEGSLLIENGVVNKIFQNDSYIIKLDFDKNIKVEASFLNSESDIEITSENFPMDFLDSIIDKKVITSNIDLDKQNETVINNDEDDLINLFAYIYNLGEQSIKPGESVVFDQKPILSSLKKSISFSDSSIILSESGIYDVIYYAQAEGDKNIKLALFINDLELPGTSSYTTHYNNTLCSQHLIVVSPECLPVTITLRNCDTENDAIFNESLSKGQVNLSLSIRKIS